MRPPFGLQKSLFVHPGQIFIKQDRGLVAASALRQRSCLTYHRFDFLDCVSFKTSVSRFGTDVSISRKLEKTFDGNLVDWHSERTAALDFAFQASRDAESLGLCLPV